MRATLRKLPLIVVAAFTVLAPAAHAAAKATTGRATIKGVDYHYEVRGEGEPLLLLHGGLGNSDMFEPLLPAFAGRQLIAVDLQGHGRSSLGNRPIPHACWTRWGSSCGKSTTGRPTSRSWRCR